MAPKEQGGNPLTLIVLILFVAGGLLVVGVIAVFIKRQITRFAQKSKSGQHIRIGHNVPKKLKLEIRRRLNRSTEISHEPALLHTDAVMHTFTSDDFDLMPHLYRMKALDCCQLLEAQLTTGLSTRSSEPFDVFLRDSVRLSSSKVEKESASELCSLYRHARHEPKSFNEDHYKKVQGLVAEINAILQSSRRADDQFIRPIGDIDDLGDEDVGRGRSHARFRLPIRETVRHLAGRVLYKKRRSREYQAVPSTESMENLDETSRL